MRTLVSALAGACAGGTIVWLISTVAAPSEPTRSDTRGAEIRGAHSRSNAEIEHETPAAPDSTSAVTDGRIVVHKSDPDPGRLMLHAGLNANMPEVGVTTRVERESLGRDGLRITVSEGAGYYSRVVRLDLQPHADAIASVVVNSDSLSSAGSWSSLEGEVSVSTWNWNGDDKIELEFALYGIKNGRRVCAHAALRLD